MAAAVPVITANIAAQGHAATVREVVAADVHVLTLAHDPEAAVARFHAAAQGLRPDTRNLILGCSAAASIAADLQARVDATVIDGVTAAARLCRVFALD